MLTAAETFEQIIRHNTAAELVPFLLALDKKDLISVRTRAKSLYKELDEYAQRSGGQWSRLMHPRQSLMLFLAGLATYSKQEGLGRTFNLPWGFEFDEAKSEAGHYDLFLAVVRHSRPGWLTAWFERVARNDATDVAPYAVLRQLTDEGLISSEPWLLAQAVGQWLQQFDRDDDSYPRTYEQHILRQLRADPVLLGRDLWLLFEFDTTADWAYLYLGDDEESVTWLILIPQLAASGHLNRAELCTRCLLALRRDFRRPLLSWFKDVFLALKPTADELLAHQADLLELLTHPLAQVVNFALDQLKGLWLLPGFDAEALFPYADSLLTRPDLKTGLKALLSGFDKLAKASPALAPQLAPRYAAALAHPNAGVQERAAKNLAGLLGARKPLLDEDALANIVADVQGLSELLSTPARTVLAPWLAAAPAVPVAQEAYVLRTGFVPDISAATAIVPVANWHELLFLTGQALQPDQPAEQERWLDGLLRLRTQYPADYAAQLRPYLLQVLPYLLKNKTEAEVPEILSSLKYGHYDVEVSLKDMLRPLLISWFGGFARPQMARPRPGFKPDPLLYLTWRRLLAVEARLAPGAVPLPLLSTPTHTPHWVAPTALVEKLLAYEAANQQPDTDDLVLALGRLAWHAPADAATARQQVAKLSHSGLRALLSWLLAPAEAALALPPLPPVSESLVQQVADKLFQGTVAERVLPLAEALPWLWVVAARTRAPLAHLPTLASLVDYPSLAAPWLPQWEISTRTQVYKQPWNKEQPERVETFEELAVSTTDPLLPPSPLLLYSMHAQLPYARQQNMLGMLNSPNFLLSLLPNNPAPLRWHLLRTIFCTSEGYSVNASLLAKQLRALLADGPAYDESATVLLAVGLLYSKPATRALAREVLLAAVGTGRLVPAVLGNALGRLLAGSYAPVLRLAEALPTARGISPATDDVLRQLMNALLPELPAEPLRNTAKLLAAYADLRPGAGQPLPAAVRARLQVWQTVGSLKKAVVTILDA